MRAEETLDEYDAENILTAAVEYGSGRRVGATPVSYLARLTLCRLA